MSYADFYREYCSAFGTHNGGPTVHTPDVPVVVGGNEGYREFIGRFQCGFRLRMTAVLNEDRISAQFLTMNRWGIAFIQELVAQPDRALTRGGARVDVHVGNSQADAKIELFWRNANLRDDAFWPAHFNWLKLALHELAETFDDSARRFESSQQDRRQ